MTATEYGWALAQPGWLWLAPALAVAAIVRARHLPRVRFAPAALLAAVGDGPAGLPRTWRTRLSGLPLSLELAALLCFVLAMARPVHRVQAPPTAPGRDLLLCLDVSSSMLATDLQPGRTRLQIGIELAADFARARTDDRVGIVAFARYADLRCPPTQDHAAVAELLSSLRMVDKEGPEDATALGAAVARSAAVLERSPARSKVVVVVTDGEENVATALTPDEIAPLHAAQLCAQAGIRVHTIVVGRGDQQADGTFAPLDTTAVRQLAATTGGRFFPAADAAALAAVYAAIDALEASPWQPPGVREHERFALFVAGGLLSWLLARVLAATCLQRLP